jgi:D-lactate dehydrogenase
MMAIARQCAVRVTVPDSASCCGMAGDAGMRDPTIVEAALRELQQEIDVDPTSRYADVDGWYSVNPTCEIALEEQLGKQFTSLLALVEHATRLS